MIPIRPYQRDPKWRALMKVASRSWRAWEAARTARDLALSEYRIADATRHGLEVQDHSVSAYRAEELADARRDELEAGDPPPPGSLFERWTEIVRDGEDPRTAALKVRRRKYEPEDDDEASNAEGEDESQPRCRASQAARAEGTKATAEVEGQGQAGEVRRGGGRE